MCFYAVEVNTNKRQMGILFSIVAYSVRWKLLLGFSCRNRLLLSGTPIQNSMAELWALLHFIMPTMFDSHDEFNEWFSKDIESHAENKTSIDESKNSLLAINSLYEGRDIYNFFKIHNYSRFIFFIIIYYWLIYLYVSILFYTLDIYHSYFHKAFYCK